MFIDTTGLVSLVNPTCHNCGSDKSNKYGKDIRSLIKQDENNSKYNVQVYKCKFCGKTFCTSLNNHISNDSKEKEVLYDKIEKIHAISGLSFDKIAKIIEITDNISISHTTIANIVERDLDDFEY